MLGSFYTHRGENRHVLSCIHGGHATASTGSVQEAAAHMSESTATAPGQQLPRREKDGVQPKSVIQHEDAIQVVYWETNLPQGKRPLSPAARRLQPEVPKIGTSQGMCDRPSSSGVNRRAWHMDPLDAAGLEPLSGDVILRAPEDARVLLDPRKAYSERLHRHMPVHLQPQKSQTPNRTSKTGRKN